MPNMPEIIGNDPDLQDYQFGRSVPFVRIDDEYYDQPERQRKRRRERLKYWLPPCYRQSFYRFDSEGRLLSCHTQARNTRLSWQEELFCRYRDSLLLGRTFTAKGRDHHIHLEEKRVYNEHNLLIEKILLDGDHVERRSCYHYNENLQRIREDSNRCSRTYVYNDKGFCQEERIYFDKEHRKSFLYACDERGRIVESWEESPAGQTCRVHKYQYNQHELLSRYQLINQDGLMLQNLEYQYGNFVENDWLERHAWKISGRAGRLSSRLAHSCLRSPCLEQRHELRFSRKSLKLPEGNYQGQTRVGVMHGYGRLDFFDGSYYIGHFEAGRMDGYGSFYWPDGRLYRGYFENNRMQGRGNYYLADGSLYCGVFEEGKLLSSKPYYYLSSDSRLSRENRRAYARAEPGEPPENRGAVKSTVQNAARAAQRESAPDSVAHGLAVRGRSASEREFIENAERARRQERAEPEQVPEALGDWGALYAEANLAMNYLGEDPKDLRVEPVNEFLDESLEVSPDQGGEIIKALLEPLEESLEKPLEKPWDSSVQAVVLDKTHPLHLAREVSPKNSAPQSGSRTAAFESELQTEFLLHLQEQESLEQENRKELHKRARLWTPPMEHTKGK